MLGSVHSGSKGRSFSASEIARAFAPPVLGLTPKAAHTSAIVHVGRRGLVRQEIHLSKGADDAAVPGARLTGSYRTGALPAQRRCHGLRQFAVLVVQVLLTKLESSQKPVATMRG
jgi:hypothetical protein